MQQSPALLCYHSVLHNMCVCLHVCMLSNCRHRNEAKANSSSFDSFEFSLKVVDVFSSCLHSLKPLEVYSSFQHFCTNTKIAHSLVF